MRCSTYQRSSSIRSGQGSDARPLIWAQPVIPGLTRAGRARARCIARPEPDGRARTDERHLAAQHVPQVRQLVERVAAQERADPRDPVVALIDRQPRADELGAADHRAQLVDREQLAVAGRPASGGRSRCPATPAGSPPPVPQPPAPSPPPGGRYGDIDRTPHRVVELWTPGPAVVPRAHRVPSAGSQPAAVPCFSQSHSPAASDAVVST